MRPLNILLVEDNEIDARGMKRFIRQADAKLVKHCRNQKEFNAYWPQSTADIVVLDLELGRNDKKRSGWELANVIANSKRPVPIIVWSSYNTLDTWRRIPNHENLVAFLSKDSSFDQFVGTLYSGIMRCNPDAETTFRFPQGFTSPGERVAPRNELYTVKCYGAAEHYVIDSRYIRYAETAGSARIKIYHREQEIECSNSLTGLLNYSNNPDLVQISRWAIINTRYAFKLESTNVVWVRSQNKMVKLPIGDEYRKNMKRWWGKLRSPNKRANPQR